VDTGNHQAKADIVGMHFLWKISFETRKFWAGIKGVGIFIDLNDEIY